MNYFITNKGFIDYDFEPFTGGENIFATEKEVKIYLASLHKEALKETHLTDLEIGEFQVSDSFYPAIMRVKGNEVVEKLLDLWMDETNWDKERMLDKIKSNTCKGDLVLFGFQVFTGKEEVKEIHLDDIPEWVNKEELPVGKSFIWVGSFTHEL